MCVVPFGLLKCSDTSVSGLHYGDNLCNGGLEDSKGRGIVGKNEDSWVGVVGVGKFLVRKIGLVLVGKI